MVYSFFHSECKRGRESCLKEEIEIYLIQPQASQVWTDVWSTIQNKCGETQISKWNKFNSLQIKSNNQYLQSSKKVFYKFSMKGKGTINETVYEDDEDIIKKDTEQGHTMKLTSFLEADSLWMSFLVDRFRTCWKWFHRLFYVPLRAYWSWHCSWFPWNLYGKWNG